MHAHRGFEMYDARRQPRFNRFCSADRLTAAAMDGGCAKPGMLCGLSQLGDWGLGGRQPRGLVRGDLFRCCALRLWVAVAI